MFIYIVRHGETDLNAKGIMQGWADEPLNESGIDLAEMTGSGMKDIRFDACISSPLSRARHTAGIILGKSGNGNVAIETDDRIREINFGDEERMPLDREKRGKFFSDPFRFEGFPGGENISQLCERTQGFLKELMRRDDDKIYLISTHGCALRAMLNFLYADPDDFWHKHVPYNCVVNIVEAHGGSGKLIADDKIYYDKKYCVDRYSIS